MRPEILRIIKKCVKPLINEYGFRLDCLDDSVSLTKDTARIEILIGGPRYDLEIRVLDLSQTPPKEYFPLYMMGCRAPNALSGRELVPMSLPKTVEEQVSNQVCVAVKDLCDWFPDVLSGDFSALESRDKYDQFVEDAERLSLGPLQKLDQEDPIWKKFWANDFSWIADLKERIGES